MATRAIRTGLDPVSLESDYTKYNFGIKDLWEGLIPKFEGTPLQAEGIDLSAAITPKDSASSVVDTLTERGIEVVGGNGPTGENSPNKGATSFGDPVAGLGTFANVSWGLLNTAMATTPLGFALGLARAGRALNAAMNDEKAKDALDKHADDMDRAHQDALAAEAIADAVAEAYGDYGGLSDALGGLGPLGDAPAAGTWGADNADSTTDNSSDPGPSGTGNSGNDGEG